MTKIELISGKYHGYVNGKLVVKSSSKYYVERQLASHAADSKVEAAKQKEKSIEFPINERFGFVQNVVEMVAKKQTPSVIITGEGGLGKSYTVIKALESAGLRDMSDVLAEKDIGSVVMTNMMFSVIKGFSTAKALYRILYENRNSVIVFDDCDSVLKDPDALNLLKGALDSFDRRIITWNSEMRDPNLPRSFSFKGGVIFISNLSPERLDQALKTRSMNIDLSMNTEQKLERMETIMSSDEFLPDVSVDSKRSALDIIRQNMNECKEISLRTLIQTAKIANSGNANWKQLAKYMLVQG